MRIAVFALILLASCWAPLCFAQRTSADLAELDAAINSIASDLTTYLTGSKRMRVAVVDFVDAHGDAVNLGAFLAEELATKLFMGRQVDVIERRMLAKVLEEQKLGMSGLIDPSSIKRVGNILGIDALIVGTMSEFGQTIRFNVRALSVESGLVMAAVSATVGGDAPVPVSPPPRQVNRPPQSKTSLPQSLYSPSVIFQENFTDYEEGDYPADYGGMSIIKNQRVGKNIIRAPKKGEYSFEKRIAFPNDFRLTFVMNVRTYKIPVFISLLLDSSGTPDKFAIEGDYDYQITMPSGESRQANTASQMFHKFQIVQIGPLQKFYVDDVLITSRQVPNKRLYKGFGLSFKARPYGNDKGKGCWVSTIRVERMFATNNASLGVQSNDTISFAFEEDFSTYKIGDYPQGYSGLKIIQDPKSKMNVLALDGRTEGEFEKRMALPSDFELSMGINFKTTDDYPLSICFQDAEGDSDCFILEQDDHFQVIMPDSSRGSIRVKKWTIVGYETIIKGNTFHIVRKDGTYKVYRGTEYVASALRAKQSPSVGFTVRINADSCKIASIKLGGINPSLRKVQSTAPLG